MRTVSIAILCMGALICASPGQRRDEDAPKFDWNSVPKDVRDAFDSIADVSSAKERERVRQMDPEMLERIQGAYRRKAGTKSQISDYDEEILLLLRDRETTARFARRYFQMGGASAMDFAYYENPDMIAFIAPYLGDEAPFPDPVEDGPKSTMAAAKLRDLVPRCVELPADVRAWSQNMRDNGLSLVKMAVAYLDWWKKNKEALISGDYSKVKPGMSIEQIGEAKMFSGSPAPEPPTQLPLSTAPEPTPAIITPDPTEPAASSPPIWIGGIVAIAVLAGLLIIWKRRSG